MMNNNNIIIIRLGQQIKYQSEKIDIILTRATMLSHISLDVNYCCYIIFLQKYSSQRGNLQYQEIIYLMR